METVEQKNIINKFYNSKFGFAVIVSTYKWVYWTDYKDLKPKLEKEIEEIINKLK
jgi:hypothetical protein